MKTQTEIQIEIEAIDKAVSALKADRAALPKNDDSLAARRLGAEIEEGLGRIATLNDELCSCCPEERDSHRGQPGKLKEKKMKNKTTKQLVEDNKDAALAAKTPAKDKASSKTFIVRFAGTAPNHYDAPAAQLLTAIDKTSARTAADKLAGEKGWSVNSVRQTNTAYVLRHVCPIN